MATPKRSTLDEAPLAGQVEDVTDVSARIAGHSTTAADEAEIKRAFDEKVALLMKEQGVPKPVAKIMATTGYSKGTSFRIHNDALRRETARREAAHAGRQSAQAKQPQPTAG